MAADSHGQVQHPGGSPPNVGHGLGHVVVTTCLLTAITPNSDMLNGADSVCTFVDV